ncbi:MAG: Smr/MutS family protein [Alphaproteobacteria bacterium]|nr:Smr/MutS family protein [Alphaproteobacteria bacterium]
MRRLREPPALHSRKISPEESRLWQQNHQETEPLRVRSRRVLPPSHPKIRLDLLGSPAGALGRAERFGKVGSQRQQGAIRTELKPLVANCLDNVDRSTAEAFQRGRMPMEAVLDLHGLTEEAAHRRFQQFVQHSVALGRRTVLVITGKGKKSDELDGLFEPNRGNLRRAIHNWINHGAERRVILLLVQAQPKDGGNGAWYLLLKRKRVNNS